MVEQTAAKTSSKDSSFPMELPKDEGLFFNDAKFGAYIRNMLSHVTDDGTGNEDAFSKLEIIDIDDETVAVKGTGSKFMDAILDPSLKLKINAPPGNKMYTANMGVAHKSTKSALLDLFVELEKTISSDRLAILLDNAWSEDPSATLKIIWNSRSIHLGKGEKYTFYQCLGWLVKAHPTTVVANLPWLTRPVIEKKVQSEKSDDTPVIVMKADGGSVTDFDVQYGVSHGYWKDLLNVLVLAVEDEFKETSDPSTVLNPKSETVAKKEGKFLHGNKYNFQGKQINAFFVVSNADGSKRRKARAEHRPNSNEFHNAEQHSAAKERKHALEASRHANISSHYKSPLYRALHLTVARLFSSQLRKDLDLLKTGKRKEVDLLSYAAKWAPSLEKFHDQHTLIATTIAEHLYAGTKIETGSSTRSDFLKNAREAYRAEYLSPLRKALRVVERDISAKSFGQIDYQKLPSLAMNRYKEIFVEQDFERFEQYIEKVASGKARISGAVLTPASLVQQVPESDYHTYTSIGDLDKTSVKNKLSSKQLLQIKTASVLSKTLGGQWDTLVQRIRDSGSMSSTIAICDVSGSMGLNLPDGTIALDHSVGLSLLVAEIVQPPFGGSFITFSERPAILKVGGAADKRSFAEKVQYIRNSVMSTNTNFVSVFEDLLLPLAIENKLKQEDMVRQVIVFSDMQFDEAQLGYYCYSQGPDRTFNVFKKKPTSPLWETSYERIKRKFNKAGYQLPILIFWNLNGGGHSPHTSPKPVTKTDKGTMMVSGYSQAMLKMFLEQGTFTEESLAEEEGEEDALLIGKDGEEVKVEKKATGEVDPMSGLWKAIGHKAYEMLRVVD
ncbi:hypothetical protein MMC09_002785 [Bachmanniomyces sp. S44760]|nr:hypothetical protein [Bachmanniomyces sp. S44760]